MNTVRLQELVDFALITLLDVQAMLSRDSVDDSDREEIFELSGMSDDEYPTMVDEDWLHNELVNNGDLL